MVAALGAEYQRLDVAVEQLFLLVGEDLELLEHARELRVVELKAELLDALTQRMAAAVLAEHEVGAREPDILRSHDLVGARMLEHAVLVDPRLVRERVLADDRLVAGYGHAGDARDEPRGRVEPLAVDPGPRVEEGLARAQRHHDLLE